jgi:hypothetical protein
VLVVVSVFEVSLVPPLLQAVNSRAVKAASVSWEIDLCIKIDFSFVNYGICIFLDLPGRINKIYVPLNHLYLYLIIE